MIKETLIFFRLYCSSNQNLLDWLFICKSDILDYVLIKSNIYKNIKVFENLYEKYENENNFVKSYYQKHYSYLINCEEDKIKRIEKLLYHKKQLSRQIEMVLRIKGLQ